MAGGLESLADFAKPVGTPLLRFATPTTDHRVDRQAL